MKKIILLISLVLAGCTNTITVDSEPEIYVSGSVSFECPISDLKRLYNPSQAKYQARQDYLEGFVRFYGVPNGFGPHYPIPEESCVRQIDNSEAVVIWPTVKCKNNISRHRALNYSTSYNLEMSKLVSGQCVE
ncbi:hypothetical protein [Algibacillus agarilyticus]|uniref:hypothetical protein n=1 Tax=Algibacillus agarilyticus TaxID=2234133 RepID=UPI000DCF884F|nr:hypothetical protein [Algibacillus agarilyticus]